VIARRSFGRQETAEGEAWGKIGRRNVQLCVGGKDLGDLVSIDAEVLANRSHLVGEANFHRVIAVGKILDHLRNRNTRLVEGAGGFFVKLA
jgi:hypothetical protein